MKNVYKVGIIKFIKNRNDTYITSEIIRGHFIKIFELNINDNQLRIIDNLIKSKFKNYNIYFDGGTEFYKKEISNKIEDFLIKYNIKFKLVDENELFRNKRKKIVEFINKIINYKLKPKKHQLDIINIIDDYYLNNNIGYLIWCCGLGKSLLSIFIIKKLNFKKIIIGVPSCFLQIQFRNEILQIFPNKNNILIISSNINNIKIKDFINNTDNNQPLFLITTYHSCHLLINNDFKFDFKIGDECHHLVSKDSDDEEKRRFILFHKINSEKSLYMTATKKTILNKENNDIYYCMNDETKFGKIIDEKSFKWAIDNKIITNYKIIIIENQLNELYEIKDKISSSNKNLYISVYLTLKSITINNNNPSHLLIYVNEIQEAELAKNYITEILSYGIIDINNDDLYYNSLHSKLDNKIIQDDLKQFEDKKYGIIICIQLFGECINCPIINGITIACNMISEIRIVQYLLRANRLFKKNPDKIAYYIIPYLLNDNYSNIKHIIK